MNDGRAQKTAFGLCGLLLIFVGAAIIGKLFLNQNVEDPSAPPAAPVTSSPATTPRPIVDPAPLTQESAIQEPITQEPLQNPRIGDIVSVGDIQWDLGKPTFRSKIGNSYMNVEAGDGNTRLFTFSASPLKF